jgi:hypothetical protein
MTRLRLRCSASNLRRLASFALVLLDLVLLLTTTCLWT